MDLAQAQRQLDQWLEALEALQAGQSYTIDGRTRTRVDIPNVRAEVQRWQRTVRDLTADAEGKPRRMGSQMRSRRPGGQGTLIPQDVWLDGRN